MSEGKFQDQLCNQSRQPPTAPPSVEESRYGSILERLLLADGMFPAGSAEHQRVLSASLMSEWHVIRYLLAEKAYGTSGLHRAYPSLSRTSDHQKDGVPAKGG